MILDKFITNLKSIYDNDKNTITNYFNGWKSTYKLISIDIINDKNNYQNIDNYSGKIKIINIKNQKTGKNISFSVDDIKDYKIKDDEIIVILNGKKLKIAY